MAAGDPPERPASRPGEFFVPNIGTVRLTNVSDSIIRITTNTHSGPINDGGLRYGRVPPGEEWTITRIYVEPSAAYLASLDKRRYDALGTLKIRVNGQERANYDLRAVMDYGVWSAENKKAVVDALTLYAEDAPMLVGRIARLLDAFVKLPNTVMPTIATHLMDTDDFSIRAIDPNGQYIPVTLQLHVLVRRPFVG